MAQIQIDPALLQDGINEAVSQAAIYSDSGDSNTLTSANTFATNADIVNLASANTYSDTGDITTLSNANIYTDEQVAIAILTANEYTDDLIQNFLSDVVFGGSVIPTSNPAPTVNTYYLATQAGTYTNMGGVIVASNSFAIISFKATGSVWSITQTTLDLTGYVNKTTDISNIFSTNLANVNKIAANYLTDVGTLDGHWVQALSGVLSNQTVPANWKAIRIAVNPSTTYTISGYGGATLYTLRFEKSDNSLDSFIDLSGTGQTVITTTVNTAFIVFGYYRATVATAQPFATQGMVNLGSSALPYVPYEVTINKIDNKELNAKRILIGGEYKLITEILASYIADTDLTKTIILSKNLAKPTTGVNNVGIITGRWPSSPTGSITIQNGPPAWKMIRIAVLPNTTYTISGYGSATTYTFRYETSAAPTDGSAGSLTSLISAFNLSPSGANTITTPANCFYICFGIYRGSVVSDQPFQTLGMVNLGTTALPYEPPVDTTIINKIKGNDLSAAYVVSNGQSKSIDSVLSDITSSKSVNLSTSNKLIFFGCSYTAGWAAIKYKNFINKIANFTDYQIINQGQGGNRMIDELNRFRNNTPQYGNNPQSLSGTVIWIANQGNEVLPQLYDSDVYMKQLKSFVAFAKANGAEVIVSTDHQINQIPFSESAIRDFAIQNGCYFMPSAGWGVQQVNRGYGGFRDGGHPGSRSNTHQFLTQLQGISQLPKPKSSINLYKKRSLFTVNTINDLNFDTQYELSKKWYNYNVGEVYFPDITYIDTIPSYTGSLVSANSEYATPPTTTGYTLAKICVESINPTSLNIAITMAQTAGMQFYIKNLRDSSTWEIASTTNASFTLSKTVYDTVNISVGDIYTTPTAAGTLTYTGKSYDPRTGYLLTFTASSTNTGTSSPGVLTKTSGSGDATINFLKNDATNNYSTSFLNSLNKPEGAFILQTTTYSDGAYRFSITDTPSQYLDYDKLYIIANNTNPYQITDIQVNYDGGTQKNLSGKVLPYLPLGTEQITTNVIDNTASGWTLEGNAVLDQIPSGFEDYPYYAGQASGRHINLGYNSEDVPGVMKRTITIGTTSNTYRKLIVRVSSRLFPKIFTPSGTNTNYTQIEHSDITSDSFDCGNICLSVTVPGQPKQTCRRMIGTGWFMHEVEIEIPPFTFGSTIELSLYRDIDDIVDKTTYLNHIWPLQVCYVSAQLV